MEESARHAHFWWAGVGGFVFIDLVLEGEVVLGVFHQGSKVLISYYKHSTNLIKSRKDNRMSLYGEIYRK